MTATSIKKVLVVDSDPEISRQVAVWLASEDIQVIAAPDGEAGYMRFKRELPSAVIASAQLDKVVGSVLCQRIKSHPQGKNTLVLLASERYLDQPELGARAVIMFGADGYLVKPLERGALFNALKPILTHIAPPKPKSNVKKEMPVSVPQPEIEPDKSVKTEHLPLPPDESAQTASPKTALFRGSLSSTPMPTLFLNLSELNRTGILTIERNRIRRQIFFQKGAIVHITSTLRMENPALMLVENGIITEEEYSKSLLEMSQGGKSFTEAMVSLSSLSYEALYSHMRDFECKILVGGFAWSEGHFEFLSSDSLPENVPCFDFKPLSIIFEGISRHYSLKRLSGPVHENMDKFAARTQRFAELIDQLELDARQLKFTMLINGKRKVREIATLGQENLTETYQLLWTLAHAKMIDFSDQPREMAASDFQDRESDTPAKKQSIPPELLASIMREYYRVKSSNYFRVLGVDYKAQEIDIIEALEKIEQKFHPDNLPDYDLRPIMGKLNEILEKAHAARRVLLDERTRREYRHYLEIQERQRARDEVLQAEITFKEGERAMIESDFTTARKHLERAVKLKPDEPEYYAYLGWTVFQIGRSTQNVNEIKKAKQYLNKAVAMNPDGDKAYIILGRVYAGEGNLDMAKQHFEKALKLNPECHPARKALEILEKAKPPTCEKDNSTPAS